MKKAISLIVSLAACLSLCACGNVSGSSTEDYYKLGETVSTDIFELTLNYAEFTIALDPHVDDNYFTPKEYSPTDDAKNPYVAPTGHTFAAFSYTVTNLNRTYCHFHDTVYFSGSFVKVKYNGKNYGEVTEGAYYHYYPEDTVINNTLTPIEAGEWHHTTPDSDFFMPTGQKEIRRCYVDIETEITDLTETVEITFDVPSSDGKNAQFTYLVTEADRENKKNRRN